MDSLTQIVLGAAAGELVLGRKLGNRAMVWGAIAGTLPDLDVFANPFVSPTTHLHIHRGLSHSIFFLTPLSFLLAWLTTALYRKDNDLRNQSWYKFLALTFRIVLTTLHLAFFTFLLYFFIVETFIKWSLIISTIALGIIYLIKIVKSYHHDSHSFDHVGYKEWLIFFLFALITHPLLDCFTVYGTQIFSPFSNARISWDNISVADPLYTIALGLPLWVATFFPRCSKTRLNWVILGVVLSSAYMMSTIYTKNKVNKVLETTLAKQNIVAEKFMTNPTIFNSVLWSATVKSKDSIYCGLYSILDEEKSFKLKKFPINDHLLAQVPSQDYTIQTIKWFSKGFYIVRNAGPDSLLMCDLRYGTLENRGSKDDDFIFKFNLYKDPSGKWQIDEKNQRPPSGNPRQLLRDLFKRIMGKTE